MCLLSRGNFRAPVDAVIVGGARDERSQGFGCGQPAPKGDRIRAPVEAMLRHVSPRRGVIERAQGQLGDLAGEDEDLLQVRDTVPAGQIHQAAPPFPPIAA